MLKAVKRIDTAAVISLSLLSMPLNTQMITVKEQMYTQVDNKKIRRTFLFSENRQKHTYIIGFFQVDIKYKSTSFKPC